MASQDKNSALTDELDRLLKSPVFSALVEDPGRGVALIGPDRDLVYCNSALRALFPQLDPDAPAPLCAMALAFGSAEICPGCPANGCEGPREMRRSLPSGDSIADFRIRCTPLRSGDAPIYGVLAVIERIEVSVHIEKALQEYAVGLEEKVQERTAELTASQKILREKITELDDANRELKVNRDRLIRSEKLAAVGEMSATVAHGLRNPIVSIGGFARRLLKKQQADEVSQKYLRIIIDEIDRLEVTLTELLDFVRPRKLELKSVRLGEVVEESLQGFAADFARRGITVKRSIDPGIPALDIDVEQFRRVLQNLFKNSLDAMSEGGVLEVGTSLEDGQAKISIADTGQGVGEGDIEKVFHPFYTSKPNNSGLGLAVCNQIIAIHGGHIKLQRRLPQGLIFEIYLPVTNP